MDLQLSWVTIGLLCGSVALVAAISAGAAAFFVIMRKRRNMPHSDAFADLQNEVAKLQEQVERLEENRPASGSTHIK